MSDGIRRSGTADSEEVTDMRKGEIRLLIIGLVSFFLTIICSVVAVCLMIGAVAKEAGEKDLGGKISQGFESISEKVFTDEDIDVDVEV